VRLIIKNGKIGKTDMCGIFACVSALQSGKAVSNIVLQGLELILNRGYDAIGLCVVLSNEKNEKNEIRVVKTVNLIDTHGNGSGLQLLKTKWNQDIDQKDSFHICMAHSRWATHGSNVDENAHPHFDQAKQVAVIHNGIIENFEELRNSLIQEHKCIFTSQTDTEAIPHLIAVSSRAGGDFSSCFVQSLQKLKGTWALLVTNAKEPKRLYFAKNGSPLIIGFSENSKEAFVCSESSALVNLNCKRMINFADKQCGFLEISNDTVRLELLNDQKIVMPLVVDSTCRKKVELSHDHWMLQEIVEQATILPKILSGDKLDTERQKHLEDADQIYLFGCGTSYHAALFGERLFRHKFGNNRHKFIQAIDASAHDDDFLEQHEKDIPDPKKMIRSIYIMLSQSGETKDIHRCLQSIRLLSKKNVSTIYALTNVTGSLIARESDIVIDIQAGKEVSVASTKSFTAQLFTLWNFTRECGQRKEEIKDISLTTYFGNETKVRGQCQSLATKVNDLLSKYKSNSLFVLGRGWTEALAKEAALKIKEVSYIHAEAFSASSLKHGPLSLITTGVPVIFLANSDSQYSKILNSAAEVQARGGYIILITNQTDIAKTESRLFHEIIQIPVLSSFDESMTSISLIFPCQLIAYYLALVRKCNPDYPRNLAKTVTTD
jgi:glucosamine--fructose-6-phosphate aminotransferase (isomerizing)